MNFIKTAIPTALELFLRAITTMVLLKTIAIQGDSHGVALLGQFQNIFMVFALLGGGLLTNGIISLTSDLFRRSSATLHSFWNFIFSTTFCFSIGFGLILVLFSNQISEHFFDGLIPNYVVILMGLLLIPFCLQSIFISILNGLEKPLLLALTRVSGSILLLATFFIILNTKGLEVCFLAIILGPAFALVISYFIFTRNGFYKLSNFKFTLKSENFHHVLHYGLMAAISVISLPLLQLFVRTYGIRLYGVESIGIWDGVFRLFDQFLAFITSILSVYFLPQLVRSKVLLKTTTKMLAIGMGAVLFLSCVFAVFHERIITLFLSPKFVIDQYWMMLILLAGILKILGWIFSYALIAKGQTKSYLASEMVFLVAGVICYLLSADKGPHALIFAFLGGYALYSITCIYFYRRLLKRL